jgi:hypothetical protein
MDQETLRLGIAGAVGFLGFLAGIGGATLTSLSNRKNTIDTLAASENNVERTLSASQDEAERRWQLQVDRENEVWLRDAKQKAYSTFLTVASEVIANIQSNAPSRGVADKLAMANGDVRLLGSPEIRGLSTLLHRQLDDLSKRVVKLWSDASVHYDPPDSLILSEAGQAFIDSLVAESAHMVASLTTFEHLAREDIGADGTVVRPKAGAGT